MAGSWSFISFLGWIVHLRGVLRVAPGLVLAGVEDGSGEGVFGVEHVYRDSAVVCYSCLAAMDAGLRGWACVERLFERGYMARSPLSFTLEVGA